MNIIIKNKKRECRLTFPFERSEDRDRTYDLWVMSPTSYRCSTSRCGCEGAAIIVTNLIILRYK